MMTKKNPANIWIIDDNSDIAEIKAEIITKHRPDAEVKIFTGIVEMNQSTGRCDLIFIDLSAISPIHLGAAGAYKLIGKLLQQRPHVPIVILSAIAASYVEQMVEMIKEDGIDGTVGYACVGLNMKFDIQEALDEYLPH